MFGSRRVARRTSRRTARGVDRRRLTERACAGRERPIVAASPAGDDDARRGDRWHPCMRLDLGCSVRCADTAFGELADVIVDPISRRVTHLVVEPHRHHEGARLVPIDRVRAADDGLVLDYSRADVEALEPLAESAYIRAGEHVVA